MPPGYPLALAAGARSGLGEFRSAGLINGALFAVTLWFSLRIIESVIGRRALSVWGAAMLGTSVSLLNNYSMMWSEPLFFASLTVGVAALLEAIDGHGWVWLAITSLALSAACFTRYAGIAIVPAVVISLLLFGPWPLARRVRATALVMAGTSVPVIAWVARNHFVSGGAVGRVIAFHPIDGAHLRSAISSFQYCLAPEHLSAWIRTAMLLAGGVGSIVMLTGVRSIVWVPRLARCLAVLVLFAAAYLGFIVASITFVDFATPLDYRILAPLFILLFIAASIILGAIIDRGSVVSRSVIAMVAITLVAGSTMAAVQWLTARGGYGDGFTNREWQQSETIAAIRQFRPEVPLITNGHEPVYVLTGRVVFSLPERVDGASGRALTTFDAELQRVAQRLRQGAVLVYFTQLPINSKVPSAEEVAAIAGPLAVTRFADGSIYTARSQQ